MISSFFIPDRTNQFWPWARYVILSNWPRAELISALSVLLVALLMPLTVRYKPLPLSKFWPSPLAGASRFTRLAGYLTQNPNRALQYFSDNFQYLASCFCSLV